MPPSLGSLVQYSILGLVAYILAGAPLLDILSPHGKPKSEAQILSKDKLENLVIPEKGLICPEHGYKVFVFQRDPLVVYIEGFLSAEESEHIVRMSESKFRPSTVWTEGVEHFNPEVRNSEKAQLDRDTIVQCIENRALQFQGWRPHLFIEKLWSQRYVTGGHYRHHYDWSTSTPSSGRVSSFMVYLEANCTGGGTNFPRLRKPEEKSWCKFVECGEGEREEGLEGVTFKPVKGNAVFWENLRPDGSGYDESWHAGLPVRSGAKIGLNIWSWYQKGYAPEEVAEDVVKSAG
ncbi:hypothetical protein BCR34DRAFT_624486 [Clohesyomyces aquaticus]|uniref:Prolyl 4-hydroxylase alpha subunit domain-containing protein n=1 Tax=Clohesyomyces aquaticus TaxID=1231657 RepID=A0A1Y1ZPK6_9PLEO|nr:hypothetical protein BCR34DRAFT_624486 [Clohesyomyces aquaticus]